MSIPLDAPEILDREFLEVRARILQLGATLDRLSRADGKVADDPRMANIRRAIGVLLEEHGERAEQIQMIFSRKYEPQWQEKFFAEGSGVRGQGAGRAK